MSPHTCATPPTSAPATHRPTPAGCCCGQSSPEFLALIPLLCVAAALVGQALIFGTALVLSQYEAYRAAHSQSPARMGPFDVTRIRQDADGLVSVQVRVPRLAPWLGPGQVRASATGTSTPRQTGRQP